MDVMKSFIFTAYALICFMCCVKGMSLAISTSQWPSVAIYIKHFWWKTALGNVLLKVVMCCKITHSHKELKKCICDTLFPKNICYHGMYEFPQGVFIIYGERRILIIRENKTDNPPLFFKQPPPHFSHKNRCPSFYTGFC